MTIERQYGKLIFTCDVGTGSRCDEQIETGLEDFIEALAVTREAGWGSVPYDGGRGWMHFCGNCPRPR